MAAYIPLLQFTDQGIRNVKDTTKRAAAATDAAAKLGVKFTELFWTLGPYDLVIVAEAPDDETMTALNLKLGATISTCGCAGWRSRRKCSSGVFVYRHVAARRQRLSSAGTRADTQWRAAAISSSLTARSIVSGVQAEFFPP